MGKNRKTVVYKCSKRKFTCTVHVGAYTSNGSLGIWLEDANGEEIAISVNLQKWMPEFHAGVKNYGLGQSGVEALIEEYGLAQKTGRTVYSGLVQIPVYQFDPDVLEQYDPKGAAVYRKGIPTSIVCARGGISVGDMVLSSTQDKYTMLIGKVLSISKPKNGEMFGNAVVDFMAADYSDQRIAEIKEVFADEIAGGTRLDELLCEVSISAQALAPVTPGTNEYSKIQQRFIDAQMAYFGIFFGL